MRSNRRTKVENFASIALLCIQTFIDDKIYSEDKLKKANLLLYLGWFFIMLISGYFLIVGNDTKENTTKIFEIAISSTTQLLGFLISGFAIFAALSDRDLVYLLKKTPATHKRLESYYDQAQIYFFEPFIFLGLTCIFSFIGNFLLMIWPTLLKLIPGLEVYIELYSIVYATYFYLFFLSFISLKDFVFNIFQIGKLYSGFELARPDINSSIKKMGEKLSGSRKNDKDTIQ